MNPDVTEITAEQYRARFARPIGSGKAAPEEPKAKRELADYLTMGGFGRAVEEYRFHPVRLWRADWALLDQSPAVLIEYDGLMRHGENHGHGSINGILRDAEKGNAAQALGFRWYRFNAKSIADGSAFAFLESVLEQKQEGRKS